MKQIRIVLKSGTVLPDFPCETFDAANDKETGQLTGYYFKGGECPKPLYIALDRVDAIVVISDDGKQSKPGEDPCKGCSYKAYSEMVSKQGDCNDCGKARTCQYVPRPGSITRINCPLWRAKV